MPKVSIVIPVYNEAEGLPDLLKEVDLAMSLTGWAFELILVDDGSRDTTAIAMEELATRYPWLSCIYLIRNYGQSTALQAGFDVATSEYVVTLDGDLQNDPADIPALISILEKRSDIDVISGWRQSRQDATLSRKIPSRLANALISWVTGVHLHDYGCALKAYRAEVIKNLRLYGELHRFIPALAVEVGARMIEIPVQHRPRRSGKSKYGLDRTVRVLLDLLWIRFMLRFLHRPIHAFGTIAMVMLSFGLGILSWLATEKVLFGEEIGGRPILLLGVLLTLVGVQLLATGLIGELLVRIYHEPQGRPQYLKRSRAACAALKNKA
ncbi:MAG: glycosyltransferase [Chitinophagia bacterium]|nr:glycosyltransferase [Chitinophagia bacterium]